MKTDLVYSHLYRLWLSPGDICILDQILTEHRPGAFRQHLRARVHSWVFEYVNGMDFLSHDEWEYLRLMYRDKRTHERPL